MERKRERDRLRKMTTSLREECEVDSSSSNTISLFLLETDTQSQHTSSLKECQTVLPLKDCAGRENGVNGSEMLLTVLRTQVRFLPFPSCFCYYNSQDLVRNLGCSWVVPQSAGNGLSACFWVLKNNLCVCVLDLVNPVAIDSIHLFLSDKVFELNLVELNSGWMNLLELGYAGF